MEFKFSKIPSIGAKAHKLLHPASHLVTLFVEVSSRPPRPMTSMSCKCKYLVNDKFAYSWVPVNDICTTIVTKCLHRAILLSKLCADPNRQMDRLQYSRTLGTRSPFYEWFRVSSSTASDPSIDSGRRKASIVSLLQILRNSRCANIVHRKCVNATH